MIHRPHQRSRRHWLRGAALGSVSLLLGSLPCSIADAQVGYPPGAARDRDAGSVDVFYDALAPDGEWIWQDAFGWVWSPYGVPIGWRPYSDGRWVYTDDGWFWESDQPWGWATFHYGRWYDSPEYGWLWVPGSDWAPAWVDWRFGRGYVGWAPLPPRARFGIRGGLSWQGEREIREPEAWSFVPERELLEPRLSTHIEYEPRNVSLIAMTRPKPNNYVVVNQRIINHGPDVVEVQRMVGHPVRPMRLDDARSYRESRREGETLRVYRPHVRPLPTRPAREPMPPRLGAAVRREERERRHQERLEQIDRYETEQRRALAERHAREEREARAKERAEVIRRHERERREQQAEIARHRRAAQAAYERRRRADDPNPSEPQQTRRRSERRE